MAPDSSIEHRRVALAILLLVVLVQAVALAPELSAARYRHNDSISHFALIHGMADAVERGDNPLDFWSAETSLGLPLARWYQPFAHLAVTAVYFLFGKTISLWTLFLWAQYLAIVLLPASFYFAARCVGLPRLAAAAAALLAPLIAGPGAGQMSVELRTWMAFGAWPQAIGASLLLIATGVAYRAIRTGRHVVLAGALLGVTLITHLIYGWMAALTACLIALLPDAAPLVARLRRLVIMGVAAAAIAAFQLLPILSDGYLINRSRIEPAEKFDSIGAARALQWLFSGMLLDNDRLPVITLLAFAGIALAIWRWRAQRKIEPAHRFLLGAAAFWLLVFFGRPTWGGLLILIGATADLHLHRTIGAVQIFLVLLAGVALAALWRELARRWHWAVAAIVTVAILFPAAREREIIVRSLADQGRETQEGIRTEGALFQQAVTLGRQRGGRLYAGQSDGWGAQFTLGRTPVASYLMADLVPAVSGLFNATSLTSDLIPRIDETNPEHYRLFNIRTMLAPPIDGLPGFLKPTADFGRFRVFEAPGDGYFAIVDAAASAQTTRENFYALCNPWMHSDWPASRRHIWLDFAGDAPKDLPRVTPGYLPPAASQPPAGTVANERKQGQVYEADLDLQRPAYLLFRMAWHPNWKVLVDGVPVRTAMFTPGFTAAPVDVGRHHVVCRYEPGNGKWFDALGGLLLVLAMCVIEYRLGGSILQRKSVEPFRSQT